MDIKPNFLILGAAKCGTTTLYAWFRRHPEIGMPEVKEPRFFAHDDLYEGEASGKGWPWYASLFEGMEERKAIGEASPRYAIRGVYPQAADRINRDLPDAKLIYIVRHPLRRIESAWIESRKSGAGTEAFDQALQSFPKLIDGTRYWYQIEPYLNGVKDRKVLVLFLEDLKADPAGQMKRCFEFLEVDPSVVVHEKAGASNVSQGAMADTGTLAMIRRNPVLRSLGLAMPTSLRQRMMKLMRKPITERPHWNAESLAYVRGELEADVTKFLKTFGKPKDFYDWDDV